ncbi:hypothetical protein YC2023_101772 [Brassica napus]
MEQEVVEPSVTALKKEVWKLKTSRKIKHFLWQAISGFITAASRLCATDRSCLRCGAEEETINHILFECPLLCNAGPYRIFRYLRAYSRVMLYLQILIISYGEPRNKALGRRYWR